MTLGLKAAQIPANLVLTVVQLREFLHANEATLAPLRQIVADNS